MSVSNLTDFQAKYFAFELTKRCPSDSLEKLSSTLSNAQVDLNPHQIDAALFAFKSPLSKGVILADEVGLDNVLMNTKKYTKKLTLESCLIDSLSSVVI